jgi:hypothetical protein
MSKKKLSKTDNKQKKPSTALPDSYWKQYYEHSLSHERQKKLAAQMTLRMEQTLEYKTLREHSVHRKYAGKKIRVAQIRLEVHGVRGG